MNKLNKTIMGIAAVIVVLVVVIIFTTGNSRAIDEEIKGEEIAVLTQAPIVPPPITRKHPTKVIAHLETREVVKRLADGVDYLFWTFGGDVPGSFIRIREGDEVEFHLHNHPTSKVPHDIDLHAVTGPGGGAKASFTAPGKTSVFAFKALNPGLYVYHCATAPVGLHVANGMYGLILVEPKEGLPKVDREYYIMQSEFYTEGTFGEEGFQPFSQEKALAENPAYVVFNGSVGALTGDNAIRANVGETVRLYLGNGGPNLISSFHVIGEIFDNVYGEGGTMINQQNVQTTLIPAGGSAIVDFKVEVPGSYVLVDHSIFRAFNKGAIGILEVTGPENKVVYSGKIEEKNYFGHELNLNNQKQFDYSGVVPTEALQKTNDESTSLSQDDTKVIPTGTASLPDGIDRIVAMGKRVYDAQCMACHQSDGKGMVGVFPPVANSDWMKNNKEKSIDAVVHGLSGPITVNGKQYNGIMPPVAISDVQVAAVLTYIYQKMNNSKEKITVEEVSKVRNKKALTSR